MRKPRRPAHNPVAKALAHPVCRPRVVEVKTRYRRRPKHVNTTSEKE